MTLMWIMFTSILFYTSALIKFEVIETKCDLRGDRVPPGTVMVLELVDLMHNQVVLLWESPDPGSRPITYYLVAMKCLTTNHTWEKVRSVAGSANGILIDDLNPEHTYDVRVRAFSRHGVSKASEPIEFTTPPEPVEPVAKGWRWWQIPGKIISLTYQGSKYAITSGVEVGKNLLLTAAGGVTFVIDQGVAATGLAKDGASIVVDKALVATGLAAGAAAGAAAGIVG